MVGCVWGCVERDWGNGENGYGYYQGNGIDVVLWK
jgi:hypothetical protein